MQRKHIIRCGLALIASVLFCTASLAEVPEAYLYSELQREVYMPNGSGPFRYYAQNDPVWQRTIYEAARSDSLRIFGDGGCNPTSLAMVVASLVPTDRLNLLGLQAAKGRTFTLCSCSVNKYFCHQHRKDAAHVQSTLVSGEDFLKVLPLAIGDFATGNNSINELYRVRSTRSGGNGGTSKNLFQPIADAFGLRYELTKEFDRVLGTLERGGMAIALCSGSSQIFSGSNGHYVVLCSFDEEYIYVMDPYVRDEYKRDRNGIIEAVDVGIKKVKLENINRTGFGNYALFEPASPAYYASIPLLADPYGVAAEAAAAIVAEGPHRPT